METQVQEVAYALQPEAAFALRCSIDQVTVPAPSLPHHAKWRMTKGLYSDAGLAPAITSLSYPETHAFPRGARRSRFPLTSLPHFYGLISPLAKSRLRRSFSNAPSRGFTPLHVEQGWSALLQLPCPCRPTSMQPSLGCN